LRRFAGAGEYAASPPGLDQAGIRRRQHRK